MSKLATLIVALGLSAAGAPVLAQQPAPVATISSDSARAIALARVANNQGVLSEKLKTKRGVLVYEFDIETPGPGHQEVRVDARTGAVVASKHESDLAGKVVQRANEAADTAKKAAEKVADKVFAADEIAGMHPAVSMDSARAIAMKTVPNAPIKDVDLETENGILVWEIDLDTAGPGREEVVIDANTGAVLRRGHED